MKEKRNKKKKVNRKKLNRDIEIAKAFFSRLQIAAERLASCLCKIKGDTSKGDI
mgnify:FL=1